MLSCRRRSAHGRLLLLALCALGIGCNALAGIEEPPPPASEPSDADASLAPAEAMAPDATVLANDGGPLSLEAANQGVSVPESADHENLTSDANDAPNDDAPPDASRIPDAADDAPGIVNLTIVIMNDADDGTWISLTDERLHYGTEYVYVEVGNDAEAGRTGLRYVLPVPSGATIRAASLSLHRVIGDALATETMRAQVYESSNVPPFDDTHVHRPEAHDPGGLWATFVPGFAVGSDGDDLTSPDLGVLVQHVIDRPDWTPGGTIGFVLSADQMGSHWVDFTDSVTGYGATLNVSYTMP